MPFGKQDFYTFLIGLGAAAAITLGEALVAAESATDLGTWGRNLLVGLSTSAGRYIVTFLAQRGLAKE